MPSYILHLLHGDMIIRENKIKFSEEDLKKFRAGLLMPDSKRGYEKKYSHFNSPVHHNKELQVPDMDVFSYEYQGCFDDSFVIGYAAHLYLDKVFFKDYFPKHVHYLDKDNNITDISDDIVSVHLTKSNITITPQELYTDDYLYGEYTKMNHIIIQRHDVRVPEDACFMCCIREVEAEDYSNILTQLKGFLSSQIPKDTELKIFDIENLEKSIEEYAVGFIKWYKKQRFKVKYRGCQITQTISSVINPLIILASSYAVMQETYNAKIFEAIGIAAIVSVAAQIIVTINENRLERIALFGKKREEPWTSNESRKNYCKAKWNSINNNDSAYIDMIYEYIDDIQNQSTSNKVKWKVSEYFTIGLTAVITLLNAVAAAFSESENLIVTVLTLISAGIAAIVTIISGIKTLAAFKETWLRHSKSRARLDMECQKIANDFEEYENAIDSDKIKLFKTNTTKIIQDDYDKFFANMNKD